MRGAKIKPFSSAVILAFENVSIESFFKIHLMKLHTFMYSWNVEH